MNAEAVVQGIEDALADAEPKLSPEEIRATLTQLKQKIVAEQRKRSVERELELVAEGKQFLDENAGKEGVVTTESGLQYKVIEEGTGKSPGPEDQVTVHYRGTLVDGKEFDSSHKRGQPATFKLNGVVKGWSEGLQLMKEGGKAQLFIPSKVAYGDRGPLGHRALMLEVELISVMMSAPWCSGSGGRTTARPRAASKALAPQGGLAPLVGCPPHPPSCHGRLPAAPDAARVGPDSPL